MKNHWIWGQIHVPARDSLLFSSEGIPTHEKTFTVYNIPQWLCVDPQVWWWSFQKLCFDLLRFQATSMWSVATESAEWPAGFPVHCPRQHRFWSNATHQHSARARFYPNNSQQSQAASTSGLKLSLTMHSLVEMAFPGPEASRTTDSATARRTEGLPLSPLLLNPGLGENHFSVSIGEVAAYSTKIDLAPDTDSGISQWERWCFTSRASCQLPQKRFMPNGRNIGVCPKKIKGKTPKSWSSAPSAQPAQSAPYHALRCRTSWANRHDVSFGVQSSCHRNACSKGSRSWGFWLPVFPGFPNG